MVRLLQILERITDCRPLQLEMTAELLRVVFQLASLPRLIGDLVELVQLLVDVLDVVQRRKGAFLYLTEPAHVGIVPEQDGIGTLPIPSGTACFLIIGLNASRHLSMEYIPYVGFVYTHTKGFGSHHQVLSVVIKQLHITRWFVTSNKSTNL